ncbi:hypothetical protein [Siphonobacter curvatus]|uniref:Uncharacterized protein n=1 Tax=Siphonobacter curvatus TaxID=2094562 RepID=A0A2S7IHY8_9BACT|nr:hypothetical protein [Siphonobacter curvatus]PQA55553.1 hypothetical protein C5O19_19230 [Siphonobacter curvatus]
MKLRSTLDEQRFIVPLETIAATNEGATQANQAFDERMRAFLNEWIDQGTESSRGDEISREEFVENGALRSLFQHREDALEWLLQDEVIARHLLRSAGEVHFSQDAYEPLLSSFEKRLYNLAAHREHREVCFRYHSINRQDAYGNTIEHTHAGDENIGLYFGTRRTDAMALQLLADQLKREASEPSDLPIHVITEGYMSESLQFIKEQTEALAAAGIEQTQCFLIQRRHAADDRHLGAALLLMNPKQPHLPQRIVFCDTLRPGALPPWWDKFKHKVDVAFPQPEDTIRASDLLEDGSVTLQRLHDGVPIRHQDIDCGFYTFSIVRALIKLAQRTPECVLMGTTADLVTAMTGLMKDYYQEPDQPKDPEVVRKINILNRWNLGREALSLMKDSYAVVTA